MSPDQIMNPAEIAAKEAQSAIAECIDTGRHFLVEAGAGAGKTYSLVEALRYLKGKRGEEFIRRRQQVACITFTNVAVDEIRSRTDSHPAIHSSTLHAFFWSLISAFQSVLRAEIPAIKQWGALVEEAGGIGRRRVVYNEIARRFIDAEQVSLHHDDVLFLGARLLSVPKFRHLLRSRFPVVFIDEYQDTDAAVVESLKINVLSTKEGPQIGFFGDHWQKIYGNGCGAIEHPELVVIGKRSNFRSAPVIVDCLNRMRPGLPQVAKDPNAQGRISVFHTNGWKGERLSGAQHSGDLPPEVTGAFVNALAEKLASEGWVFGDGASKILMLTHKALASQQGYRNLADVFPFNDHFIKKEDPHVAYLVDVIEHVCRAFDKRRYGDMLSLIKDSGCRVASFADKGAWFREMEGLLRLRSAGTVGEVLDYVLRSRRFCVPDVVAEREGMVREPPEGIDEKTYEMLERVKKLRNVAFGEVSRLSDFIDDSTPFSTDHGVKGAEFENVLVVFGRGWNLYNFGQFLESVDLSIMKKEAYERNRNLFYVACSRPKRRLALLFTQELSSGALLTLGRWFGDSNVYPLGFS